MSITRGQTVRFRINGQKVWGTVRTDATATAGGLVVRVELLPDFLHLLPTGWTDANVDELTVVRICACATLAYKPTFGDHKDQVFTTGCDFSRMPSRTSKFLPGHDAKAKGFLIKAFGQASTMLDGRGLLEAARELGPKIAMKVAEGMEKARVGQHQRATSRRRTAAPEVVPAQREDTLTEAQRLQRELGVTDPMLRMMAHAVVNDLPGFRGSVSGPTGTQLALKDRGLISWGRLTDLAYKVMDQPPYAEQWPEHIGCKDDRGSYERHNYHWDEEGGRHACKRCDAEAPEDY